MFYKNGDAISGGGWDDTRLQKPGGDICPATGVSSGILTGHEFIVVQSHSPRGITCRVKHSRILLSTKLMT
ncbi:TPA: hypothetical protein I4D67_15015 [Enterobacter hormaechei]|nr:hypothetical protein [Enterobacter hormaechei]